VRKLEGVTPATHTSGIFPAELSAASIDAILDEALSGHTTAGTLGKAVADILEDTGTTLDARTAQMKALLTVLLANA
jgi:hypothetical protein